MKKLLYLLLLTLTTFCYAQDATAVRNLDTQIRKVEELMILEDHNSLADYVCPKITNYVGRDSIAFAFKSVFDELKHRQIKKVKFSIESPSKIYSSANEYQCVTTTHTELKNDSITVFTESSILFISYDKGRNWCFVIDAEMNDYAELLNLNAEIIIPERKVKVVKNKL